jgi:hypothetical protein
VKGESDIEFLSFNLFFGLIAMYCITEVFSNIFNDKKYKFIGSLVGALLGGYVLQQLIN